jgi:ribokinase
MDFVVQSSKFPLPGQTVLGSSIEYFPGGKGANQAVAAARVGAQVTMIGAVGSDVFGEKLLSILQAEGISTEGVRVTQGASGIASITVSSGENTIIVVPGANGELTPEDVEANSHLIEEADIVLVQLEIPLRTVEAALKTAKRLGKKTILNPAPAAVFPNEWLQLADIVTPNETELAALIQAESGLQDTAALQNAMQALQDRGANAVLITLGANGAAMLSAHGQYVHVPGHKVEVVDTTGAGDCFHGALAAAWASGQPLPDALAFAIKASALSVTKAGAQTGMPSRVELDTWKSS